MTPEPGATVRKLSGGFDSHSWTSRVTVASIEARAGEWLMLHAAGVSDSSGAVAALIGPSGTGKTSAAEFLCRTEFGYVTDEIVAVARDGAVLQFPRPLAKIPPNRGPKVEYGPDELGLAYCPKDLRLGGVIVLERSVDQDAIEIESLDLLVGLTAIIDQTSALPRMPEPLAWAAENLERAGGVHRVRYAEATALAPAIERALAAPPTASGWVHYPSRSATVEATQGALARTDYVDAIGIDDRVLVLIGAKCLLLQGAAGLVWQILERPQFPECLTAAAVAAAGEHPEAEVLVAQAVATLRAVGAVTGGGDDPARGR